MLKRIVLAIAAVLVIALAAAGVAYVLDAGARKTALREGGTVVATAVGPVEYRLVGDSQDDVVLFFHGTPGGYDQGLDAQDGARVLTLSRPGYLGTPLASGATPAAQAAAALALLDVLGIERVAVMGASGGGPAAYSFAATYPDRTLGLVAMEAISHSMPDEDLGLPESDFLFWLMIQGLVLSQDDAGVVAQIAQNPADRSRLAQQPATQARVAGMIWSVWPPSMRQIGFENDMTQFQRLSLPLSEIRVPTLIVHGTADQAVPYEHAEYAAARIPGAELYTLEGAGHMMPFANETEIDARVTAFFDAINPSGLDQP